MKPLLKRILWLTAVLLSAAILIMLFTGIVQSGMKLAAETRGSEIPENILFGISGTIGSGLGACVMWIAIRKVKRLGFYHCPKPIGSARAAALIIFTFTLCRIVLPDIWTYATAGTPAPPSATAADPDPLWMMLLFGVVLAPLCEELLFRKDLFSLLLKRIPMPGTILLTALIFALIHGYSAEGFVSCLVVGILLAVLMARTGSLTLCIATHMLCNLEAFIFNRLETIGSPLIATLNGHTTYNPTIFTLSALLMLASLLFLVSPRTRRKSAGILQLGVSK